MAEAIQKSGLEKFSGAVPVSLVKRRSLKSEALRPVVGDLLNRSARACSLPVRVERCVVKNLKSITPSVAAARGRQ